MWQIFSLLGMFSNALENSIDKYSIIKEDKLDYAVSTFLRVLVYMAIIVLVGIVVPSQSLHLFVNWQIIVFGIFGAFNSLSYTYALRRIEVTNIGTMAYVAPVLFLLIDLYWLHAPLSIVQILGIFLLVIGGIGFSIDGSTRKMKKEISLTILGIFVFWLIYGGAESYIFKYFNATQGINATTLFANIWAWSAIILLLLVLVQRKTKLIFTLSSKSFIKKSVISKSCDVGNTLFTAQALIIASVSQVSAMEALSPIILFFTTLVVQGVFNFHINERLDKDNFIWKSIMITFLVVGGFLVR